QDTHTQSSEIGRKRETPPPSAGYCSRTAAAAVHALFASRGACVWQHRYTPIARAGSSARAGGGWESRRATRRSARSAPGDPPLDSGGGSFRQDSTEQGIYTNSSRGSHGYHKGGDPHHRAAAGPGGRRKEERRPDDARRPAGADGTQQRRVRPRASRALRQGGGDPHPRRGGEHARPAHRLAEAAARALQVRRRVSAGPEPVLQRATQGGGAARVRHGPRHGRPVVPVAADTPGARRGHGQGSPDKAAPRRGSRARGLCRGERLPGSGRGRDNSGAGGAGGG
ncbi:unnamed protein product, partial [Scytosiphon promiscuus]